MGDEIELKKRVVVDKLKEKCRMWEFNADDNNGTLDKVRLYEGDFSDPTISFSELGKLLIEIEKESGGHIVLRDTSGKESRKLSGDEISMTVEVIGSPKGLSEYEETPYYLMQYKDSYEDFREASLSVKEKDGVSLRDIDSTAKKLLKQKVRLISQKVEFDDDTTTINIEKHKIPLPAFKNEHYFCREMFQYKVEEPVDWSIVCQRMDASKEIPDKGKMKPLQDTMYRVNNRVKEIIGTDDDLFSWENKSIKRNF